MQPCNVNIQTENSKLATLERLDPYTTLVEKIEPVRAALLGHPVYKQLNDLISLRLFMESHIFAVWDFMSLIKTLQRRLTCLDVPWLPPPDINSARMVNEIVLAEETDEVTPNCYISHFDLYLTAMEEIGADSSQIKKFICSLQQGFSAERIASLSIPESTKNFVISTLKTTSKSTHEVAAAFLFGREDIIPAMFRQIIGNLESSHVFTCDSLQLYIDRHNFLDEDQHVPMGQKLLKNLCGNDPVKWEQALHSAHSALKTRHSLWDGVAQLIQVNREQDLEGACLDTEIDFKPRLDTPNCSNEPYLKQPQQNQASTWVKLLELPSPFSFDEALLLCQHSDERWVAWIPNYGEIVLHTSQFCLF